MDPAVVVVIHQFLKGSILGHPRIVAEALSRWCVLTLTWGAYPVPIPYQLDHSYIVEAYTSWAPFRIKVALKESHDVSYDIVCCLREGGKFTDSKPYITARRPEDLGRGLVDLLLADCLCMFPTTLVFTPKGHLS